MGYPATTLNVNYGTSSLAILAIPSGSTEASYVMSIQLAGGFWTPQPSAQATPQQKTFVPWSQITSIIAS